MLKMKLTAKLVPYSSVVGGGLMLCDMSGRARFIVGFRGTTEGITKEESDELARQFQRFVEELELNVPERAP